MSSASASQPSGENDPESDVLIFQWRGRPWRVWRLAAILFCSLLAHAATFYLLQVAYTPTGSLQPPSAQVVLLAPQEPAEKAALNQWLKMADPALMTAPPPTGAQEVLDQINFRYVPSYAAAPPAFKSLEPAVTEINAVPERTRRPRPVHIAPGEFSGASAMLPEPARKTLPALPTRLVFRGPIEPLVPADLPPWKFPASKNNRPLEPTVYLVGVPASGGTPWLFRQPAMGETTMSDAAIDEAAHDYLARLAFRVPEKADETNTVTWGWGTFYWGREIYR